MFRHGPSCLKGPLTRARNWWIPSAKDGAQVNPMARALRSSRTALLGLIVRDIGDPFFASAIAAVTAEARRAWT